VENVSVISNQALIWYYIPTRTFPRT